MSDPRVGLHIITLNPFIMENSVVGAPIQFVNTAFVKGFIFINKGTKEQ